METSGDSGPSSQDTSTPTSRPESAVIGNPSRKRVGFIPDAPSDLSGPPVDSDPSHGRQILGALTPEEIHEDGPGSNLSPVSRERPDLSHVDLSVEIHKAFGQSYAPKPRPAIRRISRTPPAQFLLGDEDENDGEEKRRSVIQAQQRATRLAKTLGGYSAPGSRRSSQENLPYLDPSENYPAGRIENIPLMDMGRETPGEQTDDDEPVNSNPKRYMVEADKLLRHHTIRAHLKPDDLSHFETATLRSGQATPVNEVEPKGGRIPRPSKYRTGILGTLLQLSGHSNSMGAMQTGLGGEGFTFSGASTVANTPMPSPPTSGTSTPVHAKHWYSRSASPSSSSIAKLIESSNMLATPTRTDLGEEATERLKRSHPSARKRTKSSHSISSAFSKISKPGREQAKIKIHLADMLVRQEYLRKICKALMVYGAPTHRLEEYMNMSARVLEIEAQFLYIPGCMVISFDDSSIHTTEVKLVRTTQGVDLGKLQDTHEIYKDVVHDRIGIEEATEQLEEILSRRPKYKPWILIPVYGLASASVGPFAFQARLIDLPICFLLGCMLGWLQLIVAPGNQMISNVFEISAAVITSFLARGFGSIRHGKIFCFSALAQSSIALILPGFTVLSASLELQSRHIVAGSVRMVYAIIYSLFLGYGITIGTALFGMMTPNAVSATTCNNPMRQEWYYLFVLMFTLCLIVINQAKWKQAPAMLLISLGGYLVNFHSSKHFKGNAQVSNTLGALAIGVTANLHARFGRYVDNWCLDFWETHLRPHWARARKHYWRRRPGARLSWTGSKRTQAQTGPLPPPQQQQQSEYRGSGVPNEACTPRARKVGYGLAAAAMLPAIFVQVPSGLAVSGSLVSGITSANQITRNATGVTTVANGTDTNTAVNSVAFTVGLSVVQVAIGITVGLFLAALLVYPLGKRRSGLFSF
ncbi:DUF1212-domain-containing protein [Cenococcum geophilum 1.58]|uniref:DUF1212-domain-containing protein n=1 Tax=Cenococcum geophilum 1.58 TaxID=794803 RepID=A0ACC8EME5_9PEZI|nr:DUF1212-domain-containing protein [Cenococcum geophilum 1.58]